MSEVTGALAIIRQRVQQQKINDIERKVARDHATACLERALDKLAEVERKRDEAMKEWSFTDRENRIWTKRLDAAQGIVTAASERLEKLQ